ncbi:uncharacterized protein LOC117296968 [Asterias rubens]|uniref:uncharacterized protein LOC117296968 n=1 Tax=Asterias rubens TaxID=7604 RepID=UPI001454F918|nr:uncharacterized protein LOC117296968 [Asterias rubens]
MNFRVEIEGSGGCRKLPLSHRRMGRNLHNRSRTKTWSHRKQNKSDPIFVPTGLKRMCHGVRCYLWMCGLWTYIGVLAGVNAGFRPVIVQEDVLASNGAQMAALGHRRQHRNDTSIEVVSD